MTLCKKPTRTPAGVLLTAVALAQPTPALADDLEALLSLSLDQLDKVIVTVASQFEEDELSVASTTSVIPRSDWQRRGARRLTDAISNQPSVMILPTFGGTDAIAIRGFGNELSTRGIATILDGVPLNTLSYGSAQNDKPDIGLGTLDRIEMIRGPGSAIYGSDAFHGVLALHSFESETDLNEHTAEAGSRGYYQAATRWSQGITEQLRAHFSMAFSGQGDQNRNYDYTEPTCLAFNPANGNCVNANPIAGQKGQSERNYEYESQTIQLKLTADPEGPWTWRSGYYYNKYDAHKFASATQAAAPASNTNGGLVLQGRDFSGSDSFFHMVNASAERGIANNITMHTSGFYWTNHHEAGINNFAPAFNETLLSYDENRRGLKLEFRQQDNAFNTQWSGSLGWNRFEITNRRSVLKIPGTGTVVTNTPLLTREILSGVLQAKTLLWNDRLRLVYGGRIDHYSDTGLNTVKSPRAGIIWQPQKDTAYKILYGNSFRAPVGSELTDSFPIQGNNDIDPETIDSYEFVAMHQRNRWKGEFVYFYSRWKERINTARCGAGGVPACPGFQAVYQNQKTNISRGLELKSQWEKDNSKVDFSYSYVTSEDELQKIDYVAFPRHILNLGVGHEFSDSGLSVYLNNRVHYKAKEYKVFSAPFNSPQTLPHYWKVDLNVTKTFDDDLELFLNVRNLLDRRNYFPSVWNVENGLRDEQFNVSAGVRFRI